MRNLLLATALLSTLAFPAMAAQECVTVDHMVQLSESQPGLTHAIYEGQEAEAIKAGMAQMGAELQGPRVFVVFNDGSATDLLVGFKDGCYEGSAQVPHRFIDAWLAGSGA
jgi:hypothetical protein